MKKLIVFALLAIPLLGIGQITKTWSTVLEITEATDSVYFPPKTGDVAAFPWSATFVFEDLTDSVIIDIGGGNNVTLTDAKGNPLRTTFNSFGVTMPTETLPFIFEVDSNTVITDGIIETAEVTFKSPEPYGFVRPAFKIKTVTDVEFTVKVDFTFSK